MCGKEGLKELLCRKKQQVRGRDWIDFNGITIPVRYTKSYWKREKFATSIYNSSVSLFSALADHYQKLGHIVRSAWKEFCVENGVDPEGQELGNFTFYNFDKTIKIERRVQTSPEYDEEKVKACKVLFDDFVRDVATTDTLRILIERAFSTRSGKLDARKLDDLITYKEKIDHEIFQKAIALLYKARRKSEPRCYYSVSTIIDEKWVEIPLRLSFFSDQI